MEEHIKNDIKHHTWKTTNLDGRLVSFARRSLEIGACQASGCCIRRSLHLWRACPETEVIGNGVIHTVGGDTMQLEDNHDISLMWFYIILILLEDIS